MAGRRSSTPGAPSIYRRSPNAGIRQSTREYLVCWQVILDKYQYQAIRWGPPTQGSSPDEGGKVLFTFSKFFKSLARAQRFYFGYKRPDGSERQGLKDSKKIAACWILCRTPGMWEPFADPIPKIYGADTDNAERLYRASRMGNLAALLPVRPR